MNIWRAKRAAARSAATAPVNIDTSEHLQKPFASSSPLLRPTGCDASTVTPRRTVQQQHGISLLRQQDPGWGGRHEAEFTQVQIIRTRGRGARSGLFRSWAGVCVAGRRRRLGAGPAGVVPCCCCRPLGLVGFGGVQHLHPSHHHQRPHTTPSLLSADAGP